MMRTGSESDVTLSTKLTEQDDGIFLTKITMVPAMVDRCEAIFTCEYVQSLLCFHAHVKELGLGSSKGFRRKWANASWGQPSHLLADADHLHELLATEWTNSACRIRRTLRCMQSQS